MADSLDKNPFTALFGSVKDAENFRAQIQPITSNQFSTTPIKNDSTSKQLEMETSLLEKLLLLSTRNPPPDFPCVYINDSPPLSCESLDIILFERLLLDSPMNNIVNLKDNPRLKAEKPEVVARSEVVLYLFEVYERCWHYRNCESNISGCVQNSVLTNLSTALEQPELFNGQKLNKQLLDIILNNFHESVCLGDMITKVIEKSISQGLLAYKVIFEEILSEVKRHLESCSLMGIDWNMVDLVEFYASSIHLAPLLLAIPQTGQLGRQFQFTILGSLLSISCLPKGLGPPKCEFFDNPSSQGLQIHKATENNIGVAQKALNTRIYKIFMTLLQISPEIKDLLLKWLEACLAANSGKSGLWHIQADEFNNMAFVCDGFMVNLGSVLLKLALPFTKDIADQKQKSNYKILKVDSMYCSPSAAKNRDQIQGLYSADLSKQTTLIPHPETSESEANEQMHLPEHFSFTTTCFFHTHRAIHLGIHVLQQKLFKLSQELSRLQHEFQEVSAQGSPALETMRKHMEMRTSLFLSYKAATFEPTLIDDLLQFLAATAHWLIQVALSSPGSSAPLTYQELSVSELALQHDTVPAPNSRLQDVPELLVENLVESIIGIKRYMPEVLLLTGEPLLQSFMSFVAVFMGSPCWMNNPHLRAHLAECLETLLPKDGDSAGIVAGGRERLFTEHFLAKHLVGAIIHVFVSIEMTGQSVAFEEKFNYRRPMYEVMKYLWDIPQHQKQFVKLANFALAHMESAKPPLFLRFANLLMNDAIFLLDEGLSYMSQIRESQIQKDAGEWDVLSSEQRVERERNMQQNGFLARFHNMLGSRTIQMLVLLSKEIPTMFTHPTLIDRMAAMLNHFLFHLVGPKQRNLKVRDMEKYEFRPSEIVFDICSIYINLSTNRDFYMAVSADDRSYSSELFKQACGVLTRIGRHQLRQELESFSKEVDEASQRRSVEEDLAASAPEEFIDPIMSQLMTDPVLLPSSNIIVDRQTIARHLLSDQTDPFNRQSLTMEEVINQPQLQLRIQEWLKEQRTKQQ